MANSNIILLLFIVCSLNGYVQTFEEEDCLLDRDAGYPCHFGKESVSFYYDPKRGRCYSFWYAGCGGNENRFHDKDVCLRKCQGAEYLKFKKDKSQEWKSASPLSIIPEECLLQKDPGFMCRYGSKALYFYYDVELERCKSFKFLGCGGNRNNFADKRSCTKKCRQTRSIDDDTQVVVHRHYEDNDISEEAVAVKKKKKKKVHRRDDSEEDEDAKSLRKRKKKKRKNKARHYKEAEDDESSSAEQPKRIKTKKKKKEEHHRKAKEEEDESKEEEEEECTVKFPDSKRKGHRKQPEDDEESASGDTPRTKPSRVKENQESAEAETIQPPKKNKQLNNVGKGGDDDQDVSKIEIKKDSKDGFSLVCFLPKNEGYPCASTMRLIQKRENRTTRKKKKFYYHDPVTKQCLPMNYAGCGGNGNVFSDLKTCLEHCSSPPITVVVVNNNSPTSNNGPATNTNNNLNNRTRSVPEGQTAVMGPIARSIQPPNVPEECLLPKDVGFACSYGTRARHYYYDQELQRCMSFMFAGCGGNKNNFLDRRQCDRKCRQIWTPEPPKWYPNPQYEEDQFESERKDDLYSYRDDRPRFEEPMYTDKNKAEHDNPMVCYLPKDPGYFCWSGGSGKVPRKYYYFDSNVKQCLPFWYAGCGGNGNAFKDERSCYQHCSSNPVTVVVVNNNNGPSNPNFTLPRQEEWPKMDWPAAPQTPPNQCFSPKDEGFSCLYGIKGWHFFYDPARDVCVPFKFLGCGGNKNNFMDKDSCERACKNNKVPNPWSSPPQPYRKEQYKIEEPEDVSLEEEETDYDIPDQCFLKKDVGFPCSFGARARHYYYDSERGRCAPFFFAGCGGNRNNFIDRKACQRKCEPGRGSKKHTMSRKRKHKHSRKPRRHDLDYDDTDDDDRTAETEENAFPDTCYMEMDKGYVCKHGRKTRKYSYNPSLFRCVPFTYLGCGGNGNRFRSKRTCDIVCRHLKSAMTRKHKKKSKSH